LIDRALIHHHSWPSSRWFGHRLVGQTPHFHHHPLYISIRWLNYNVYTNSMPTWKDW
jgi:hypothetical protein